MLGAMGQQVNSTTVILSVALLSRSESATESKDPSNHGGVPRPQWHSHTDSRELLFRPVEVFAFTGSFDCVAARFASGHFAQDDRSVEQ
jgi:hypothetical protein